MSLWWFEAWHVFGKIYTGPLLPLWRRLVLRHSRALAAPLCVAAVIARFTGRLPLFAVFVVAAGAMLGMLAAAVWAARERDRLVRETLFQRLKLIASYPHLTQRDADCAGWRLSWLAGWHFCADLESKAVTLQRLLNAMKLIASGARQTGATSDFDA